MKLVLDLMGPPRLMGARRRVELRAGSLSVGRSPEADWVIADSERTISRLHMRIDASQSGFVLTDTSVNGVFVNDRQEAVGYGASVRLGHGDSLGIGDARIAVTVEDAGAPAGMAPPGEEGGRSPEVLAPATVALTARSGSRDPFGGPFGAPVPAPAQAPAAAPAPAPRPVVTPNWMNEPLEPAGASAPSASAGDRTVVLQLRPGAPRPAQRPELPGSRALSERVREVTAHELWLAVEAAGRDVDPRVWEQFLARLDSALGKQGGRYEKP